jgi:hypothetical protein
MVSAFNPYNTLPVADEALEKGGVELLRAGLADGELFVTLRSPFPKPDEWGDVLAEITVNLAQLYAENGDFSKNEVIAAVAAGYRDSLREYVGSSAPAGKGTAGRKMPSKAPAKGKAKVLSKSKAKVKAPLKAKAKSLSGKSPSGKSSAKKSKSASKAVASRKGARG